MGLVIGTASALGLSRTLPGLVADVASVDPRVFAVVVPFLLIIALLACYLPARVATHVNPVETLAVD